MSKKNAHIPETKFAKKQRNAPNKTTTILLVQENLDLWSGGLTPLCSFDFAVIIWDIWSFKLSLVPTINK